MDKIWVSILICTYNAEHTIINTLNSCLSQSYQNFEILIHDDMSVDNTLLAIKSINDQRIKIINSWKKLWPYGGLNFLLEIAKGKYIAIQDHDDIWHSDKLKTQVNFLDDNIYYVWCGTKTLMYYESDTRWFEYYLWESSSYAIHPSLIFRNDRKSR